MAAQKQPPGIMLCFEFLPVLKDMPAEEVKEIIVAALEYGEGANTSEPVGNTSRIVWTLLKPRIDANKEKYQETCDNRAYGKYEKQMKDKGLDPIPREEWDKRRKDT